MKFSRRDFLQISALSAGALGLPLRGVAATNPGTSISVVRNPGDPIASSPAVNWAVQELTDALKAHGISVRLLASAAAQASASELCIVAAGAGGAFTSEFKGAAAVVSEKPESLAIVPSSDRTRNSLLVAGRDARGLMYALLELADRVRHSDAPLAALHQETSLAEQPFNPVRSVGRLFSSDVEDKPWFWDREMWPAYFSMLATQRFNRFSLNFGIGYDSLDVVHDAYLLFAYPFLVSVPGYDVRARNLPDQERERNLETLRFISRQAVAHGIDFQLGIWTHGYQWKDSTHANYVIDGLTAANHAAYCRKALTTLLKACPDISGVTIRTHGESGVREKSYAFWETVLGGAAECGRKINLDLHTKGLDQKLIDAALKTGLPLTLSPKYWAEHMGLPYQQAAIRELEMPRENFNPDAFDTLSTGSRIFTRYGYADFLREDRRYDVIYRIWPGTHRFLLWGDPVSSAAHASAFRFCGSTGVELYEPLSFKGRRGSGIQGNRCGYADESLAPRWDWEKYLYTYRVWGRKMYNPECQPDTWQRYLRHTFHQASPEMEVSLASATRILPLVTTAHLPSAANDAFGPELYLNQSMLHPADPPYWDTPVPKVFDYVTPLDPQLFSAIPEFVDARLRGERIGKYTPIEVAQRLEDLAEMADEGLTKAEARTAGAAAVEFRRAAIDIRIQTGLGRFFGAKLRAGVLHAIHRQSGSRMALEESVNCYRRARDIWARFASQANEEYVADITFGPLPQQRGHWLDRLPAIDADLAEMAGQLTPLPASTTESPLAVDAIREALAKPHRLALPVRHVTSTHFTPGQAVPVSFSFEPGTDVIGAQLYYRHVNQAERYQKSEMRKDGQTFGASIPATYASSQYPLQYYFELRTASGEACLCPGLGPDFHAQPYYVLSPA